MKKLHFDYCMKIHYSEPVSTCHYTIKCIPPDTDRQKLEQVSIELSPKEPPCRSADSFGNQILYGTVEGAHTDFFFHIMGDVSVNRTACESVGKESMLGLYRYPHGLARAGAGLKAYHDSLGLTGTAFEKGTALMHRLYQDFVYEKGVTNIHTTAEEAWRLKKGVCQDYAHIMIALARMEGIAARYVCGMLAGEGFSHAWVELLCGDGWYAFDPTNDVIVSDSHIKLGIGRDAGDCAINRGVMHGGGTQTQEIYASVSPAAPDAVNADSMAAQEPYAELQKDCDDIEAGNVQDAAGAFEKFSER